MSKVIQIRDVPDDVHAALVGRARQRDMSLTKYLAAELEHLARQADLSRNNRRVIKRTQRAVQGQVTRADILEALHAGRRG